MKRKTNKVINQTGDNAIVFIGMAIGIISVIAGYVRFLFF